MHPSCGPLEAVYDTRLNGISPEKVAATLHVSLGAITSPCCGRAMRLRCRAVESRPAGRRQKAARLEHSQRLIAGGVAGILVPSTRFAGGSNLVLWRWNDAPDRKVAALDPQYELPADQSSWPVAPPPPLR